MFCYQLQNVCIGSVVFCKNHCELCKNFEMVWFSQITQYFCTITQNVWEIIQKSSDNITMFCNFTQFAKISSFLPVCGLGYFFMGHPIS